MQCLSSVVLLLNDKKRSIQTLPKPDILCQHIQKETYCFSKRNFRQEKKKLNVICTCAILCSILCFSKYASQGKGKKNCIIFSWREEFSPRAEASFYFFVFCQLAWEAYYPGVRHTFPKGRENRKGRQSIKKGDIESFQSMRHTR